MMDIKNKIKSVLTDNYGEFSSVLEMQYIEKLTEKLSSKSAIEQNIWATYNQVILEVKTYNNHLLLQELLYVLTENEITNDCILNIIDKIEPKTPELDRLHIKIKNFNQD
jgi:hypothetical protein